MTSETRMAYGSRVLRHGRSRPRSAYQARSAAFTAREPTKRRRRRRRGNLRRPSLRLEDASMAGRKLDHGTLEALDHAEVGGRAVRDRRRDLLVGVEVAAPVRVVGGDGRRVVREAERMHGPAPTAETGVARRGRGDVGLQPAEVVDDLEARLGRARAREG